MRRRLHIGFFEDEHDLLEAVRDCRARSIPVVDVVSPYPIHGLDDAMGIRTSRLPWVTLVGGAVGLSLGLWLQYWSSATNWPLDVGGKPFDSLPAFVPVAFELTILFAGLSTGFALLFRSRLWPGKSVHTGLESTTDDRHALILAQEDARFPDGAFSDLWVRHGAAESREVSEETS
jgi:hypothetical protein